jgi:hypothetical protein
MANQSKQPSWQISGDYFESCNCDYLCPCIYTNLAAQPTKGACTVAMAFHIERGKFGDVVLDDMNFVVAARSPGAMIAGNWSVGLIIDDRAKPEQNQAIAAIASGQAGGPMAGLAPLLGQFLGAESKPIRYQKNGNKRSVSVAGMLEQSVEAVTAPDSSEPICIDNTMHPANARLALAKATRSELNVLGLQWSDTSGTNNGHFAPFSWRS